MLGAECSRTVPLEGTPTPRLDLYRFNTVVRFALFVRGAIAKAQPRIMLLVQASPIFRVLAGMHGRALDAGPPVT
jgi:hypothetical protein